MHWQYTHLSSKQTAFDLLQAIFLVNLSFSPRNITTLLSYILCIVDFTKAKHRRVTDNITRILSSYWIPGWNYATNFFRYNYCRWYNQVTFESRAFVMILFMSSCDSLNTISSHAFLCESGNSSNAWRYCIPWTQWRSRVRWYKLTLRIQQKIVPAKARFLFSYKNNKINLYPCQTLLLTTFS